MIQTQYLPSMECLLGKSHRVKDLSNITYFYFHKNSMGYITVLLLQMRERRSQKRNNLSKFTFLVGLSWDTKLGLPYILNSTLLVNNLSVALFDFKSLAKPSGEPKTVDQSMPTDTQYMISKCCALLLELQHSPVTVGGTPFHRSTEGE